MPLIQLRLRAPDGQARLEIDDSAPLQDLVALIRERTKLRNFSLKYGYPLKTLDVGPTAQDTPIRELSLRGETLVVAPLDPPAPVEPPKPKFTPKGIEPDETSLEWRDRGGYLVLRVMPDDNSCMCMASSSNAVRFGLMADFTRRRLCKPD